MFDISFPVAFGAGLISFFAPCVVPLIPAYVAYVTGVSLQDTQSKEKSSYSGKIIFTSLFYIFGFSLIFVLLGTAAAGVGYYLRHFEAEIRITGGVIIFIFGLNFSGILNFSFLARERKISLPVWIEKFEYLRAFTLGVIFALAWTPCVGAILGAILSLAAVSQTVVRGAMLLFTYSLGISLPFLIISLTLSQSTKYMPFITRKTVIISKVAGILLAILGIMLITDTYRILNAYLFEIAYSLGYQVN